jgi:hypothetical protein
MMLRIRLGHSGLPGNQHLGAKPTIGDVRRDHLVTVRGENGGHRSSATTRLPDRATKLEASEQRLGDPIRRGVEVAASPVESGSWMGRQSDGGDDAEPFAFAVLPPTIGRAC